VPYDAPLARTREIIGICRQVWRRERLIHDGAKYQIPLPEDRGTGLGKPLKLINHPLRSDIPVFRPGDSVRVHVKVVEGNRSRIQVFAGVVIARSGEGVRESFIVRKVSFGVGVERTFPLHSPIIDKIEVERRGDVRRAKLYYLRGLRGKAAKIKEKRDR